MARKQSKTANNGRTAARNGSAKAPSAAAALEKADVVVGKRLARRRHNPLVRAAGKATKLGDQGPLYAAGVVLLAIGLVARNGRLARTGVAVFAAVAAADGTKRLVKRLVRRSRPNVLLDEGRYAAEVGGTGRKAEQSFPSGHVAASLAAARAVGRQYPRAGAAASVAAAAVGLGRVARAEHWPLDVAAGAVIGIAAERLSGGLLRTVVPSATRMLS